MSTVNRIYEKKGEIGKNQLKDIAKRNHLELSMLIDHCLGEGLNVVNFGGYY